MARGFIHPTLKDIHLDSILYALSDPSRRTIFKKLLSCDGMSCSKSCDEEMSPSTLSFHFKVLRESGLIFSEKKGVEVINKVRWGELNKKFPGLIDSILKFHKDT